MSAAKGNKVVDVSFEGHHVSSSSVLASLRLSLKTLRTLDSSLHDFEVMISTYQEWDVGERMPSDDRRPNGGWN